MSDPERLLALGIDTSTSHGSVGLSDRDGPIAQIELNSTSNHVERLLPAVTRLLADAGLAAGQLGLIAVATGPGSFTGVRIAMATGKGLALAAHLPLAGYSTLETMALAVSRTNTVAASMTICIILRAGRGELYRGLYRVDGARLISLAPEAAMPPALAVRQLPERCALIGDGVDVCLAEMGSSVPSGWITYPAAPPIGTMLATRAVDDSRAEPHGFPVVHPNYLRLSDAEVQFRPS